jgi:hypothetical protein
VIELETWIAPSASWKKKMRKIPLYKYMCKILVFIRGNGFYHTSLFLLFSLSVFLIVHPCSTDFILRFFTFPVCPTAKRRFLGTTIFVLATEALNGRIKTARARLGQEAERAFPRV